MRLLQNFAGTQNLPTHWCTNCLFRVRGVPFVSFARLARTQKLHTQRCPNCPSCERGAPFGTLPARKVSADRGSKTCLLALHAGDLSTLDAKMLCQNVLGHQILTGITKESEAREGPETTPVSSSRRGASARSPTACMPALRGAPVHAHLERQTGSPLCQESQGKTNTRGPARAWECPQGLLAAGPLRHSQNADTRAP